MNKRYLSILLLFINVLCFSQNDSLVKTRYDHNLTISFPGKPDSMHKLGSEIYYLIKNNRVYQAFRNDSIVLDISNKKGFETALKGAVTGFGSKLNQYKLYNHVSDSTIGGAMGKFIYSFKPDTGIKDMQLITFITFQDNKGYFLQISSVGEDPNFIEETKPFIQSARFFGKPYDELESSASYKIGYFIGSIIVYGLLIAGIIWLIRKLTRRKPNRGKAF